MSRSLTFLLAILAAIALSDRSEAQTPAPGAGSLDYYILALSWSPAYCEREGRKADPTECGANARPGLVMHGLWPQRDAGPRLESCPTATRVPGSIIDAMLEIMPSVGLIVHEWEKHGSCSGMTPDDYFAEARATWERVRVPPEIAEPTPDLSLSADEVKRRFIEVNDTFALAPDQIVVICERKRVSEVRVCVDKDLDFRRCGKDVRDTCRPEDRLTAR